MNSPELRVILDDNTGGIQYSGGEWTLSSMVQWYQGTSNYPAFAGNGVFGSFNLTFEGTSIAFIGNTPPPDSSQFSTISIDRGTAYNSSYGSRNVPQSYIQWYQSPLLPDRQHVITVDNLDQTAIDIVIITVGPTTSLTNRTVFIDNNDPAIEYTGNWTEDGSRFDAGNLPDGFPVGNTTQRTATIGDVMIFRFSGTSISIYGILSWTNIGSISVAYTLDGAVEMQSYLVTENSPQYIDGDGEATNFLFFEMDAIPPVYSPSFSSLATMPDLTSTSTTTSQTSTKSNSSIATQTGVTPSQGGKKASAIPVGAIVGEAAGGTLALISLGIIMFLYLRNRNSKAVRENSHERRSPPTTNDNPFPQMAGLSTVRPTSDLFRSSINGIPHFAPYITSSDQKRDRARNIVNLVDNVQRDISLSNSSILAPWMSDTDEHEHASSGPMPPPAYDSLSIDLRLACP